MTPHLSVRQQQRRIAELSRREAFGMLGPDELRELYRLRALARNRRALRRYRLPREIEHCRRRLDQLLREAREIGVRIEEPQP